MYVTPTDTLIAPALRSRGHAYPPFSSTALAALAERSLLLEVQTWPKPGLVSHIDAGSHTDMDARTFSRSASALRPYFAELADAGARDEDMQVLRTIGLRAERAMLEATGGVNTHRGAIFGLGLLCAAAGLRANIRVNPATSLGVLVAHRWGRDIISGPVTADSHGEQAGRRYGAGGARWEAAKGFPCVYQTGIPALRLACRLRPDDAEAARVQACFALIAVLGDTNLLHRAGAEGLRFAQCSAQAFIDNGGVGQMNWRGAAEAVHLAFVARGLSPGGAADLLAMSIFVMELDRAIPKCSNP